MRCRLIENGCEIGSTIKTNDSLHIGGCLQVAAEGSFEGLISVGNADEGGQVCSGGVACDDDFFRREVIFVTVGAQKANGGFEIVSLRGNLSFGGGTVMYARDGVTIGHESAERHLFL